LGKRFYDSCVEVKNYALSAAGSCVIFGGKGLGVAAFGSAISNLATVAGATTLATVAGATTLATVAGATTLATVAGGAMVLGSAAAVAGIGTALGGTVVAGYAGIPVGIAEGYDYLSSAGSNLYQYCYGSNLEANKIEIIGNTAR